MCSNTFDSLKITVPIMEEDLPPLPDNVSKSIDKKAEFYTIYSQKFNTARRLTNEVKAYESIPLTRQYDIIYDLQITSEMKPEIYTIIGDNLKKRGIYEGQLHKLIGDYARPILGLKLTGNSNNYDVTTSEESPNITYSQITYPYMIPTTALPYVTLSIMIIIIRDITEQKWYLDRSEEWLTNIKFSASYGYLVDRLPTFNKHIVMKDMVDNYGTGVMVEGGMLLPGIKITK